MPSNSSLYFITKIINLHGVKVTNYHFLTEDEILIELENKNSESICPHCQAKSNKVHQCHRYRIRDIPLSGWNVFLNVNRRQFRCQNCGKIFSEELSFVRKRRTYTVRLAEKVIKEVLETDVVNAGRRNGMSAREIETLLKELASDLLEEKSRDLKRLGIDEITQLKGGKNGSSSISGLRQEKTDSNPLKKGVKK